LALSTSFSFDERANDLPCSNKPIGGLPAAGSVSEGSDCESSPVAVAAACPPVAKQGAQKKSRQDATVRPIVNPNGVRKGILLHRHTDATKGRTPHPGDSGPFQMPSRECHTLLRDSLPKGPLKPAHHLKRFAHHRTHSHEQSPSPQMSPPGRPASPRMRSAEQPTSPQAATVVQPVPRRSHAIERIISHREPSPKQSATEDLHKAYREAKEWLISA
jgi:hypothetical protein